MGRADEIQAFESRFADEVVEIAAVTGPAGIGAGRASSSALWTVFIPLIAWKELGGGGSAVQEALRLQWVADDKEWQKTRNILAANTVVRLEVRRGVQHKEMMLVKVVDAAYRDDEMERILQEALQPVYYEDELLGTFELNKTVKTFEKDIVWGDQEGTLYFDWDEDEGKMKASLETAYELIRNQTEWDARMRAYAAEKLVELANEWLPDDDEAGIDEITEEMFVKLMAFSSISVNPEGDFEVYFDDGDLFGGHAIIVSGHKNGTFKSAQIAG